MPRKTFPATTCSMIYPRPAERVRVAQLTAYRRVTQLAFMLFIVLLPVFNILRYDTDTHELFLFGAAWGLGLPEGFASGGAAISPVQVAFRFFLKGLLPWLVFLSVFPLLGYFTGRFFCGWLCPEGALFELADQLTLKIIGRRNLFAKRRRELLPDTTTRIRYGMLAIFCMLVIPLFWGVVLTGYFVAPKTVWQQVIAGHLTFGVKAGITGVAIYMLITSLLVRHVLCRFICAAGLMQVLFGWIGSRSLRLTMDVSRISACTDCKGCDRACFMEIQPRKNKRDISCVNCGACVDACNRELGRRAGLFRLGFGR